MAESLLSHFYINSFNPQHSPVEVGAMIICIIQMRRLRRREVKLAEDHTAVKGIGGIGIQAVRQKSPYLYILESAGHMGEAGNLK